MILGFESFANSERYKTITRTGRSLEWFESFANSERYKTEAYEINDYMCLRALLIQKDTKRMMKSESK